MKRHRLTTLALVLTLAAVSACTPKDTAATADAHASTSASTPTTTLSATTASATTATTAGATASASSATGPDPLPGHGDVAKKVRGEVTKQNYKAELDKLEKEPE